MSFWAVIKTVIVCKILRLFSKITKEKCLLLFKIVHRNQESQ
jgi:hypothetical protein